VTRSFDVLWLLLHLKLPDEIRLALIEGAIASDLEAESLLEAHRSIYVIGFCDGFLHALDRGGRNE
jgi:hypothetical protein